MRACGTHLALVLSRSRKTTVGLTMRSGPRGFVPTIEGLHISGGTALTADGIWFIERGYEAATPTHSYFLFFRRIPASLAFGQLDTEGQMFFWSPPGG